MARIDLDQRERSLLIVALDMVDERLSCTCPMCTGNPPGLNEALENMPESMGEELKAAVKSKIEQSIKEKADSRRMTRVQALELKARLVGMADADDDGGDGDNQPAGDPPKPPAEDVAPEPPAYRNPTAEELYGDEKVAAGEREPALSES